MFYSFIHLQLICLAIHLHIYSVMLTYLHHAHALIFIFYSFLMMTILWFYLLSFVFTGTLNTIPTIWRLPQHVHSKTSASLLTSEPSEQHLRSGLFELTSFARNYVISAKTTQEGIGHFQVLSETSFTQFIFAVLPLQRDNPPTDVLAFYTAFDMDGRGGNIGQ